MLKRLSLIQIAILFTAAAGLLIHGQIQAVPNFDCSAVSQIPTAECDALVSIYVDANGDNWSNNSGWLINSNPCNWEGVRCSSGRVTRLTLQENGLSGTLSSQVGNLSRLTTLQLNNNQLGGNLPTTLGDLDRVTWLRLENNSFSGAIPSQIGDMSRLQYLYLSDNDLSGSIPAGLGNASQLIRLYLSGNLLSGNVPSELGNLSDLNFMLFNNNADLTGGMPLSFTNLSSLSFLHIMGTDLCEPDDSSFQAWLNGVNSYYSNADRCTDTNTDTDTPTPRATFTPTPRATDTPTATSTCPAAEHETETKTPTPTPTGTPTATPTRGVVNNTGNYCEGISITDNRMVAVPQMNKPAAMQPYTDPAFGADVMRISDARYGGVIKTAYNTIQAWNADESYLILYHTGTETAGHHLYNGQTYEYIRQLNFVPRDLEQFFWDDSDPNSLYFINRVSPNYGDLIRLDVRNDSRTVLTNFDSVCGQDSAPQGGNDVQMMSWDSDKIGLRCGNSTSANPVDRTFYYTVSTNTISPVLDIGQGTSFSPWLAAQMAPSGNLLSVGASVLDANMNVVRELDYTGGEHSSLGRTYDGHDGLFTIAFNRAPGGCNGAPNNGVGTLIAYDLETGDCRPIISEANGYNYPLSSTHPSAVSRDAAGWVVISSIGYPDQVDSYFTNNQPAPVLFSEIYLANTDPDDEVVCRLAHHRSTGKLAGRGNDGFAESGYAAYFGEPHPIISPSGTRILFSSDWYNSGSVDTYVIELPVHE